MIYQICGDKLTIYLDDDFSNITEEKRKKITETILGEQDINWIVVDCKRVEYIGPEALSVICDCSGSSAELLAINTNEITQSLLAACFVDVSLGFHYIPDADKMYLVIEDIKNIDMDIVRTGFEEFLSDRMNENEIDGVLNKVSGFVAELKEKECKGEVFWLTLSLEEKEVVISLSNINKEVEKIVLGVREI